MCNTDDEQDNNTSSYLVLSKMEVLSIIFPKVPQTPSFTNQFGTWSISQTVHSEPQPTIKSTSKADCVGCTNEELIKMNSLRLQNKLDSFEIL